MKLQKRKIFNMLAVDQRGSFVKMLKKSHLNVNKTLVREVKKDIIEILSPHAGAVLIDPVYSLKLAPLVKENSSLLFCLERSGPKEVNGGFLTELQPSFSVAKAKKLGADAVKLNLHYNPLASEKILVHQQRLVKKIGKDCKRYDVPFLLEIIVYPLFTDVHEFALQKPLLIIRSVKEFSRKEYGVKILKLQFPCDLDYVKQFRKFRKGSPVLFSKKDCARFCSSITKVTKVPWVLLSAGVHIDVFVEQLKIAMKNGCSGFLAGRAVWKNALSYDDPWLRLEWLKTKGLSNLKKLNKIVGVKR